MTLQSYGFDGTVTELPFAYMWGVGAPGVDTVENAAAWKVTQGTGRQVSVAAQSGYAFGHGVLSKESSAAITASLTTPVSGQWYLIVRHIDWTSNAVTIVALPGGTTSATLPTAPPADYTAVTMSNSPGVQWDHVLGWAWVRNTDTSMVLFDLRRVPGSAADLAELATLGGPEGETKFVREGGATFERIAGVWTQKTPARFASASTRDTAYAKASSAYLVQGAQVYRADNNWTEEYSAVYNSSTNLPGRAAAGWYPIAVDIQRAAYQITSSPGGIANGVAMTTGGTLVVKRRPYKQRVRCAYVGNIAASVGGAGSLRYTASAGGTLVLPDPTDVLLGGSGVAYLAENIIEIAAGAGADVTISVVAHIGSGSITAVGITTFDFQVEGEW